LAADPANVPALRTDANFAERLGDYHAVLAASKTTPVDEPR
jgi:hypothetical protein